MGPDPILSIRSAADLRQALRWRGTVTLQLPDWSADFQGAAARRLNFWRGVCGCHLGSLVLLTTLGLRVPAMLRTPGWTVREVAWEGAIALLAALAGKVAAIGGARILLAVDVARLHRRARHSSARAQEV